MLGFALRKANPARTSGRPVALDLNANRIVAIGWDQGASYQIPLDPTGAAELPLLLRLDAKPCVLGASCQGLVKKLPHTLCSNFLGLIGTPSEWTGERLRFSPETALETIFGSVGRVVAGQAGAMPLCVPAYLSRSQIETVASLATKCGLPISTTMLAPLAVAARRASWLLSEAPALVADRSLIQLTPRGTPDRIAAVVIVDVDQFALTASYVTIEPTAVQFHAASIVTRAAEKLWRERLIDMISDVCIRKSRRDPRDAADTEQSLWEQLYPGLDRARSGHALQLSLRCEHWYQDLTIALEALDDSCRPLAELSANAVREVVMSANGPWPPRAVWLSEEASHLPGLANALHQLGQGELEVQSLPSHAPAEGAVALAHHIAPGMYDRLLRGPWQPAPNWAAPRELESNAG